MTSLYQGNRRQKYRGLPASPPSFYRMGTITKSYCPQRAVSRGREVTPYKAAVARDGVLISLQRQEPPGVYVAKGKEVLGHEDFELL